MSEEFAKAFLEQAKEHLQQDFLSKIHRCLAILSDDEIWWRANENTNSVGNLVLHLCGNVRQWIISGLGRQPDTRQRDLEFSERGPISRDQLVDRLNQTLNEALEVLTSLQPDDLSRSRRIQVYEDISGLQAIFHVVEHFSYHTGQIIYITRMIKNVDLKFYRL